MATRRRRNTKKLSPYGKNDGEFPEKDFWIYSRQVGITNEYWPKAIKAITDVMQSHTWEQTWNDLSDHLKVEMSRRFLMLIGGNPEFSVSKEDEYDYMCAFESIYKNLRQTEKNTQSRKIFIDKERFLELERKVELLWLAPGMPGCLEEIEQAIKDF